MATELRAPRPALVGDGWPGVVLSPLGRGEGERDPQGFIRDAIGALDLIADRGARRGSLVALPMPGTREGGGHRQRGAIVAQLLHALEHHLDYGFPADVILVSRHAETHAAVQRWRARRIESLQPLDEPLMVHAKRVAARAAQGDLVLFLGASASAGSGLPDWSELLAALASRTDLPEQLQALLRSEDLPESDRARIIGDALSAHTGDEQALGEAVVKAFGERDARPGLLPRLLAELPIAQAVTTNYDAVFETACEEADGADPERPVDPRRRFAVLPYERLRPGQRWIVKLHGDLHHPGDIVLSRDQFLDYTAKRGALRGVVQAMLITKHMLFVGFSLKDDNFVAIAHEVRSAMSLAPRSEETLGTVLQLERNELRERLWPEFASVAMTEDDDAGEAKRRVEIFVDCVAALAHTGFEHLTSAHMEGALSEAELAAREALIALCEAGAGFESSPVWQRIRSSLADFGGAEG